MQNRSVRSLIVAALLLVAYGQHRFPTTFIVDGAGVIRHLNRGFGSGYEERMRKWLRPLTTRSAP
jgi:hypothetical protein